MTFKLVAKISKFFTALLVTLVARLSFLIRNYLNGSTKLFSDLLSMYDESCYRNRLSILC